jgi:hypothetical protein
MAMLMSIMVIIRLRIIHLTATITLLVGITQFITQYILTILVAPLTMRVMVLMTGGTILLVGITGFITMCIPITLHTLITNST